MSARNWRRAVVLAVVIVIGWLFSLVVPWLGFVVGCGVGAFWFWTLEAARNEETP